MTWNIKLIPAVAQGENLSTSIVPIISLFNHIHGFSGWSQTTLKVVQVVQLMKNVIEQDGTSHVYNSQPCFQKLREWC